MYDRITIAVQLLGLLYEENNWFFKVKTSVIGGHFCISLRTRASHRLPRPGFTAAQGVATIPRSGGNSSKETKKKKEKAEEKEDLSYLLKM